jgi:hypothetical protein
LFFCSGSLASHCPFIHFVFVTRFNFCFIFFLICFCFCGQIRRGIVTQKEPSSLATVWFSIFRRGGGTMILWNFGHTTSIHDLNLHHRHTLRSRSYCTDTFSRVLRVRHSYTTLTLRSTAVRKVKVHFKARFGWWRRFWIEWYDWFSVLLLTVSMGTAAKWSGWAEVPSLFLRMMRVAMILWQLLTWLQQLLTVRVGPNPTCTTDGAEIARRLEPTGPILLYFS